MLSSAVEVFQVVMNASCALAVIASNMQQRVVHNNLANGIRRRGRILSIALQIDDLSDAIGIPLLGGMHRRHERTGYNGIIVAIINMEIKSSY